MNCGAVRVRAGAVRALAVACVVVVAGAGCSEAVPGQPVAQRLPQGVLSPHYSPEPDPLHVFKEGLFEPLVQPTADQVRIPGYRSRVAADGITSKVSVQDYNPYDRVWEPLDTPEIVWSPAQGKWVTTRRAETLSAGPLGSRDRPTVKSVADYGTSYYTVSFNDLAGQPLADGLPQGLSEGTQLPESTRDAKFSPGARAYETTTTLIGPLYIVTSIANAITKESQRFQVYSCDPPSPDCQTVATSLEQVAQHGGKVTNFAGTAELDFDGAGAATLRPVGTDIAFANLTYRFVKGDAPQMITLQAAHTDDDMKFSQAFGVALKTLALFEYDGAVTLGNARPAYNSSTDFAGYNRIAINDLLRHWTPQMPDVLP